MSKQLTASRFKELASACLQRSCRALSSEGYVDIQKLCAGFGAEIVFRPLLCEGLIGRRNSNESPWIVAVDSETFPEEALFDSSHRLSNRLRNTIAHELVHILSFRLEELGIDIPQALKGMPNKDIVAALETETESLSPLMLLPTSALNELKNVHSIDGIVDFCVRKRVSTQVFIQRLNLLARTGEILNCPILKNCIIGICDSNRFRPWPMYYRSDDNLIPAFVHDLLEKKIVHITSHFESWDSKDSLPSYSAMLNVGTDRNRNGALRAGRLFVQRRKRSQKLFYVSIRPCN
ncbi:hypothetical protein [Luteolibacter sp. Populi]|uniref:hypothetical protein n=1 Tax=Luteolibacter sp. Populi TaxID=3230487 RepID=UPI00346571EC